LEQQKRIPVLLDEEDYEEHIRQALREYLKNYSPAEGASK